MADKKKKPVMAPFITLPPGVPPPIFALPNGGPLVHAPFPPGALPVPYDPYQYAYPPPPAAYAARTTHPPPPPPGAFPPPMPIYYPGPPPPPGLTYTPAPPAAYIPHNADHGKGHRHHHHHHHNGRHHHHHGHHDKAKDHDKEDARVQFIGDLEPPSTTEKLLKLRNSVREQVKSFNELAARQDELERRESKRERKLEGVYRAVKERQMEDHDMNRRTRMDVDRLRRDVRDLQLEQQPRNDDKGRRLSVESNDTWTTTRTPESDGTYTYVHTPYSELGRKEMKDRHMERRKSTHHHHHHHHGGGGNSGKRHITIESDEGEHGSSNEVYIHIRYPCKTCKEKVVIRTEKVADAATKGVVKQRLGLIIKDDDIYQADQPEVYCEGCKAHKEKEERDRIYQEEKERREQKEKEIEAVVERVLEKKATNGEYYRVAAPPPPPPPPMPGAYPEPYSFHPEPMVMRSATVKEGPTGPRPIVLVQRSQSSASPRDDRPYSVETFSSGTKVYRMPSTVVENEHRTEVNIKIPKFAEPNTPPADYYVNMNGGDGNDLGRRSSNAPAPPTPARRVSPTAVPGPTAAYRKVSRSSAPSPEEIKNTPHDTVMHYHHHYHHDAPSSRRASASSTYVEYESEEGEESSSPSPPPNVRYEHHRQQHHRLEPATASRSHMYDLPTLGQHNYHHGNPPTQRRVSSGANHHSHHQQQHADRHNDNFRSRSPVPVRRSSHTGKRVASEGGPFLGERLPEVTDNPSSTMKENKRSFTLPESILKSIPISVPPTFIYKQDFSEDYNLEEKLEAVAAAAAASKEKDEGVNVQLSPLSFNFYENENTDSMASSSTTKVNSIPENTESSTSPAPVLYGPDFGHKIYNVKDHQAVSLTTTTTPKSMKNEAKERKSTKIDMNISININGKPITPNNLTSSPSAQVKSTPERNKAPPSMLFFSHITPTPHNTPRKQQKQQRYLPDPQPHPPFMFGPFSQTTGLFDDREPQVIHGRCATVEDDMDEELQEQNNNTGGLLFPPGAFPTAEQHHASGDSKEKPAPKRVSFDSEESEETLEGNWGTSSKKAAKYDGGGRPIRSREEENGWTSIDAWD